MATLAALRAKAKRLGITASVIRGATSASELEDIISDHEDESNGTRSKSTARKAVKKSAVKKSAGRTTSRRATATKAAAPKRGPGRPRKVASSKPAPAKSRTGAQAKRRVTATTSNGDAGRFMLGDIDYSYTEGWNPREDSAPDRIVKALRKFRGNRDKVFDLLVQDLWDFVSRKKSDGTRRKQAEAENLLRNRIAQTDWRFAIQTGQHVKSENRAEYGSSTGNTARKATPAKKAPAKAAPARRGRPPKATQEAPKRRGRPPGSKNKPRATATAQAAPKRRGRPPGSKNKPKTATAPRRTTRRTR